MNFLTLAWFGQNSVVKFLKTLLFTLLWTIPGVIPMAIYTVVNNIESISTQTIVQGNAAGTILVLLDLTFVAALFGLIRQMIVQYDRDWITLITPQQSINWRKFLMGAVLWGSLMLVFGIIDILQSPQDYVFSFQLIPFVSVLIGALASTPFQASTEEILFRGYIMQQSALIGRFVWVPLLISTLLFALAHSPNPEVAAYGFPLAMSNYALLGMIFGITAIMDDGLEIAMGMHTGNNIVACLFITEKNSALQTPALFTNIHPSASWLGVAILGFLGIIFLFICSRLYKWGSWSILWSKIIPPAIPDAEPFSDPNVLPQQP